MHTIFSSHDNKVYILRSNKNEILKQCWRRCQCQTCVLLLEWCAPMSVQTRKNWHKHIKVTWCNVSTCSVLCSKAVNLAIKYSRVATASFPWNQQTRLYFTYFVFFSLLVYVFNLHAFYFTVCITIIRTYLCAAEMKRIQRLAKFKGKYRFK